MVSDPRREMTVSKKPGIHVFAKMTLFGKRWFWHGRAGNSEITLVSEAYNSRQAAYKGISSAQELFNGENVNIWENDVLMNTDGRPRLPM